MNHELISLLACPQCGSAGLSAAGDEMLSCPSCGARYPVINGVPQMLPAGLSSALERKEEYTQRLMAATRRGQRPQDERDPDTDRLMWEHHLYSWGKEVIFSHRGAADIFTSYAENGARDLCRFIQEWTGDIGGRRLLYVGSGNDGLVSRPLEAAGAFLVSLDVVNESLQDLRQSGARNCVCGDARCLPFRDGAFDVVFCKGSLHHSQPIDRPLQSMARVTRSGGHIIAAEPNRYTLPAFPLPGGLGQPTPYEHAISSRDVMRILATQGVGGFHTAAFTLTRPGTPPPLARLWERLGAALPWLLDRFAFEFILHGRKAQGAL